MFFVGALWVFTNKGVCSTYPAIAGFPT